MSLGSPKSIFFPFFLSFFTMSWSILFSEFQLGIGVPSTLPWLVQNSMSGKTCPLFCVMSVKKCPFPPMTPDQKCSFFRIPWSRRCGERSIASCAVFRFGQDWDWLSLLCQICLLASGVEGDAFQNCSLTKEVERGWRKTENSAFNSDMKKRKKKNK